MPDITPKPKPKNYSKILDVLNTPQAAKTFSPKTYIDLVGQYSRKAFDNGEISKKEYMSIVKPLFGDAGIMASDKIKKYKDELNKYANGGRIGFLDGGDTKYNAMVTEMYIKLGGEEGTGMDIDSFAKEYFKKFNQGGRVGYQEGKLAQLGNIVDLKNIPYYASKTVEGAVNAGEILSKLPFAVGNLVSKIIKRKTK
jgi:hypothetical protein